MNKLTPTEERVYKTIKDFIEEKHFPPTNKEIGKRLDGQHEATIREHVKNLKHKGWIEKAKGKPRTIRLV